MSVIARRLLFLVPALLGVIILTFFLGRLAPGDPMEQLYGYGVDQATIDDLRHHYGLDQPLWLQLLTYLFNLAQGDLGISYSRSNTKVTELMGARIGPTLLLTCLSILLASILGIGFGMISALTRGRWPDRIITAVSTFLGAMPGFVMAYLLVWLLAVNLNWLPTGGWGKPENVVLPVIVASLSPAGFVVRVCRSSISEVLRQDFIKVAHAKGLHPNIVLYRHILRNSLPPILTVIGPIAARAITGLFFVEAIFGVPGLAYLIIDSVPKRDYAVIQASTLFLAIMFILLNLLVDVLNMWLDPRIKMS